MRVGVFGGSFDPIHDGHLRPVAAAVEALRLDRVHYVPTARPPHKPERSFAPAWARYVMVELALLEHHELLVSPVEMSSGEVAYTIDTLEHFRGELPDAELFLLLGSDSFVELPTWRRWRELAELAELAVLVRPGWKLDPAVPELDPHLVELARGERVHFVPNPPVEVSATGLRRALARGEEPPAGAMPDAVLQYARKYRLYR